jgi:hypothetical protein
MAVSVLTFVNWRSALVQVQTQLQGGLSNAQSAEGYSLMQTLLSAGATYDVQGDDSPRNVSAFSVGICQPYMIQAVPAFAELDRICRLIYSTYASTATLAQGQAFGLYTGLGTLPPGILSPSPLVLLWDTSVALWALLQTRTVTADDMVAAANNAPLTTLLASGIAAANPLAFPPVDPNPAAGAASSAATIAVNAAVLAVTTWISSLSFS